MSSSFQRNNHHLSLMSSTSPVSAMSDEYQVDTMTIMFNFFYRIAMQLLVLRPGSCR